MRLLVSKCEKIWLFNASIKDDVCTAGLACFLPGCASIGVFHFKGKDVQLQIPVKAAFTPVPKRIPNARLFLLCATTS